jgi:hypothetical protein
MTQTNERDLHRDLDDPAQPQRPSMLAGTLLPLILAAVLAAIVLVMTYQSPAERAGDTNAGPSVQTVAPTPSPSTSPVAPTPNPTTEPRPTQAPQP